LSSLFIATDGKGNHLLVKPEKACVFKLKTRDFPRAALGEKFPPVARMPVATGKINPAIAGTSLAMAKRNLIEAGICPRRNARFVAINTILSGQDERA
jgi:hypothetical protein